MAPRAHHDRWAELQRGIGNQALAYLMDRPSPPTDPTAGTQTKPISHNGTQTDAAATALSLILRPKLAIGALDDPLEREADRAAGAVMRMAEPASPVAPGADAATPSLQRQCTACAEENELLRRQPNPAGVGLPGGVAAPPIVHDVLRSPGRPLDASARAFFEPRFGHDFSRVRIHADATASASAQAVGAHAYTVGSRIVFAPGRETSSTAGRLLLAHELAHVVQQERGQGVIGPLLRRQPAPAAPSSDALDLGAAEDLSEKNPRLVAFAAAARQSLGASPKAIVQVRGLWSSKPAFASGAAEALDQLRGAAGRRAETVRATLARLGVPAASLSVSTADLNTEGAPPGREGEVKLAILSTPLWRVERPPIPPVGPVTPSAPPTIEIEKDADLSAANARLVERLKYELMPWLREPGGTVDIVIYVGQDHTDFLADPDVTRKNQEAADARLAKLRETLASLGVNRIDIGTDVKVVPKADPRAGKITVAYKPKAAPADDSGLDLDKFTTFQVQTPRFTLVLKVPKSIELKTRWVEGKFTFAKGLALKFKPVRGLPGVEISLAGEITKLSDLAGTPPQAPALPGAPTAAPPGAPVKFSLSAAVNFKGFRIEASSEANLSTRALTTGLYVTLIEEGHKYQVPSSVWTDLNTAGAQLQKAVNALMGVTNPPAATKPVGEPLPPEPPASTSALSNLFDAVDAISTIVDAMDKIDKAKQQRTTPKLKIGPQVVEPIGPSTGPANAPSVGFGITGTF